MGKRVVAVNENGTRIGEDHWRAKLTDRDVELIRRLRADGMRYRDLAEKFGVGKTTIQDILTGRSRCQTPVGWKTMVS
jgi:DNA invertase Pin-like site-specific DNA recombinase